MSDVNSERIRHEARESVGNQPPRAGETATEAAMRRYLGAEMFDELHRPEKKAQKKAEKKPTRRAAGHPATAHPGTTPEEPEADIGEKD